MRSPVLSRRAIRPSIVVCSIIAAGIAVLAPDRGWAAEGVPIKALIVPPEATGGAEAWSDAIVDAMKERLKEQKIEVESAKDLTPAERGCRDAACFTQLVEQRNVDLVFSLKAAGDSQKPPTVYLTLFLFDRAKPFSVPREDNVCQQCTKDLAATGAGQLVNKALGAQPPALPPSVTPVTPAEGGGRKKLLLGLGIASAVLAAGSAGVMVWQIMRNGSSACPSSVPESDCGATVSTTTGIAIGAVGTGVFAAASVGFFLLARRAGQTPPAAEKTSWWLAPVVTDRQIAVGIGGRF